MSNTFPLYDNLFRESPEKDLTKTEKDNFIKLVKNIDNEGSELFYALIKCYQLQTVSSSAEIFNNPFSSKIINGCYKFELELLPHKLKQMLILFLKKHNKKMKEEESRPNIE